MSFDFSSLIFDRTAADFQRWEYLRDKGLLNMSDDERAEWLSGMKGAYSKTDLNRVGEALNHLRGRLATAGYISYQTDFVAKTNWTISSIPTAEDLTYYLKSVSNIREAMAQYENTPPAPADTGSLTIEEANNIEKILLDVEELINNMIASRFYSNDLTAGEI